jgi:hypothetical protein
MFFRSIPHFHYDHPANLHSASHWTDRLCYALWFRVFFWMAAMAAATILISPYLVFLFR